MSITGTRVIIVVIFLLLLREETLLSLSLTPPFFFCLFRAVPLARGNSQARGQIGAVAAGLHHSHSNTGSEPHL